MIGNTFGHYRLLEKIGAGGMGEVYRAHDQQLDRDVAIKVLPASTFSDATARARLLREARAVAALNHPHICTVHEVAEAEGQTYIVMELVEGKPLSALLAGGELPAEQVLNYGFQLADALAHAHDRGVAHRDLKSANVIITPEGRAKVLDFGLAKRLSGADLAEASTLSQASLTLPGALVGTLAYMAPELLHGQSADACSDVWALGVVLYEMSSGARPFQGQTGFELSSAILNQQPAPLTSKVPLDLKAVIGRCLEKEPARRYQRGGEVRAALQAIQTGEVTPWLGVRYALARRRWLTVAGAMVALVSAMTALNVGGLRTRLFGDASAPRIQSLAVLPLENLSGDPDQDYLARGMHEALITDLAKLSGFRRVIARESVMRYQKTEKPLPQIARELGVDALVTGSVFRSGDRVEITAHLISGSTEEQLWADRYERQLRDVLSVQNEIVSAIIRQIRLQLTPQEKARLAEVRPVNPEAYEAYLKGRFHWYKLSREELDIAEHYFQVALEKDPHYALALVGMADVWGARGDAGILPVRETVPKTKAALSRALELDDTLPEAHVSLANFVLIGERAWPLAEKEYQRAIELNPSYADAHFFFSDFLISMKRTEEWQVEIQRTLELDPMNFFIQCFYGWHLVYLHRYDEAIARLRKVLEEVPNSSSAHLGLWGAFYKKGMKEEALAEAKKFFEALHDREVLDALDRGSREAGYRRAMKRAADTLAAHSRLSYAPAMRIARLYAHAGEKDLALAWLESAYERHDNNLTHIGVGWDWDELRDDPRFQDLLRRMNFPN